MIFFNKQRLFTILVFLSSFLGLSQKTMRYEGPKKIGPYNGNARYDYYVSNADTVYNGDFLLQKSNLATLLEKKDASFSFRGRFSDGIPNDKWTFEFGEYESNSKSTLVDYEYRVLISGKQEVGGGILENGIPNNQWTYTVNKIQDSEIDQILFKSTVFFDQGIPQKNFQIENKNDVLIGRFLRDGLAHDEWSSYSSNAIDDTESWFFNEGLLQRINITSGIDAEELIVFGSKNNDYKTITLDSTYLKVVKATMTTNGFSNFQQHKISQLLAENESYYQKMNSVLNQIGSAQIKPNFKVKVPVYTRQAEYLATLDSIMLDYDQAKEISEKLLNNGHLNIVKRTDSEILYQYNTVQIISNNFIKPLRNLRTYQQDKIIENLDIDKYISQLWVKKTPSTRVVVALDSLNSNRIFELPNSNEFNLEGDNLDATGQIIRYARLSLEKINAQLSNQIRTEEDLEALNHLEEELIRLNNDLEIEKDSIAKKHSIKSKKALQKLKNLSDELLSDYAQIEKTEDKLNYGNQLITCFKKLAVLKQTLLKLPSKLKSVEQLYTDSIWNPFMALVMDEEVKKRITTPYFNILIPYFLDSITTTLTCDNAEEWTNQISHTNTRIEELRNKDTQKLERKLRKEKRPEEILKLLFQPSIAKEQ